MVPIAGEKETERWGPVSLAVNRVLGAEADERDYIDSRFDPESVSAQTRRE